MILAINSLFLNRAPGYQPTNEDDYGSTKVQRPSSSYIFCVDGNDYGVSKCCDDLHVAGNDERLNYSHDIESRDISVERHSSRSSGSKSKLRTSFLQLMERKKFCVY